MTAAAPASRSTWCSTAPTADAPSPRRPRTPPRGREKQGGSGVLRRFPPRHPREHGPHRPPGNIVPCSWFVVRRPNWGRGVVLRTSDLTLSLNKENANSCGVQLRGPSGGRRNALCHIPPALLGIRSVGPIRPIHDGGLRGSSPGCESGGRLPPAPSPIYRDQTDNAAHGGSKTGIRHAPFPGILPVVRAQNRNFSAGAEHRIRGR